MAEPFDGPALLSGRAAAVFFHEVLGHRLEGHRQRGEQEGQTFTKKVGQPVLPEFLSVIDDPTLAQAERHRSRAAGTSSTTRACPRQRVEVIKDGILKNFLMSRMPIKNFANSNGHGRSQPGAMPTGRQGNLIVSSTSTVKDSELRQKLIDEVKKQNKPYGLYFEDIQGGFTLTQRSMPQAFQVLPVLVWRVYADGRPDELVRGIDIVGTPLAAHEPHSGDRREDGYLQWHLRRGIGTGSGLCGSAGDVVLRDRSAEARALAQPPAHLAGATRRCGQRKIRGKAGSKTMTTE